MTAPEMNECGPEHPYAGDDGSEGRCECGYKWYPQGGPVGDRLDEFGFEAATRTIRAWANREDVEGPNLVAELDYWRDYWRGK